MIEAAQETAQDRASTSAPRTSGWLYRREVAWLLLAITILHQCAWQYLDAVFGPDKSKQIAATRSLLEGRGLTLPYADPGDLARLVNLPLVGWPPGYSLLIAPLLVAAGDIWWAALIADWITVAIFFVAFYVILERLGGELAPRGRVALWLFFALAYTPLITLPSSDMLALALLYAGVAVCLGAASHSGSAVRSGVLAGLWVGASCAVRFAYWPLVVVLPLALWLCGRWSGRPLGWAAIATALVSGAILALVALYQRSATGHTTLLSSEYPPEALGWHWEHLLRLDPFAVRPIGFKFDWGGIGPALSGRLLLAKVGAWLLTAAIVAALGWRTLVSVNRARHADHPERPGTPASALFYLVGALTLVLTVGMLAYLSVREPMQPDGWVRGAEGRFYAPTYGFLIVGLFAVARRQARGRGALARAAPWLARLVLIVAFVLAGAWQALKTWQVGAALAAGRAGHFDIVSAASLTVGSAGLHIVDDVDSSARVVLDAVAIARASGRPVVYIDLSGDPREKWIAQMAGARLLDLPPAGQALAASTPVQVIVAAPRAQPTVAQRLAGLLPRHALAPIGATRDSQLYVAALEPATR